MKQVNGEDIESVMSHVAHQWKQPLSQINSNVFLIDSLLRQKNIQDDQIEERLKEIERLTKYMAETIDEFRSIAKKEQKKELFYVENVLDRACQMLQNSLVEAEVELEKSFEQNLCSIGSENELLQVFLVIMNNARDVLLERNVFGAKVHVRLLEEDKKCVVQIIDNGGGMPKRSIEKIFSDEYSTKHTSEGSGLGLAMAKNMIEDGFGGTIQAYNFEDGTCFEVSLLQAN